MTDRSEIERLLNATGRTLEVLPEHYSIGECVDAIRRIPFKSSSEMPVEAGNVICHQSDVIELLIGALRQSLVEAAKPKWISVKERLPEADGMYVVYMPPPSEPIITAEYSDSRWADWEVDITKYVTHWAPLPEPPEVEHK